MSAADQIPVRRPVVACATTDDGDGDGAAKRRKLSHHQQSRPSSTIHSRRGTRIRHTIEQAPSSRRRINPQPPRQIRSKSLASRSRLPKTGQQQKQQNQTTNSSLLLPPSSSLPGQNVSSQNSTALPATPAPGARLDPNVKLAAAKPLLDQIWARNRNQHRAQPWWKSLGMLRKAITRVVAMNEAERSLRLPPPLPRTAGVAVLEAKEVRKRLEQETQIRREKDAWLDWMREVLVPRAYVAFTGLVSDRQFAALGVVLVGILADVMSVVGAPTHLDSDHEEQAVSRSMATGKEQGMGMDMARSLTATSLRITGLQSGELVERIYDSDDVGEVVERTKLETSKNQTHLKARKHVLPTADEGSVVYPGDESMSVDTDDLTGLSEAVSAGESAAAKPGDRGSRGRQKQKQKLGSEDTGATVRDQKNPNEHETQTRTKATSAPASIPPSPRPRPHPHPHRTTAASPGDDPLSTATAAAAATREATQQDSNSQKKGSPPVKEEKKKRSQRHDEEMKVETEMETGQRRARGGKHTSASTRPSTSKPRPELEQAEEKKKLMTTTTTTTAGSEQNTDSSRDKTKTKTKKKKTKNAIDDMFAGFL